MQLSHIKEAALLEKISFSLPWSESMLMGELINPLSHYIAAVDNEGRLLGYAGLQAVLDEGYIANIAVFPEWRRQGLADALINELMKFGKAQELSFLTLEVRMSNLAAISLYRKHGFSVEGRRKRYYQDPEEDAYIMTLFLKKGTTKP
jgi:ribosomal-protein-alanine N-acetyltransferase